MKKSPLLTFESTAFMDAPAIDELTNPGIFGKSLAEWLSQQLLSYGFSSGKVIPEDFGWCVPLISNPYKLYVACSSLQSATNQWQVFVFSEGGFMNRFLGKDKSNESVAAAFDAVKTLLHQSSQVHGLREEAA